jgi:hypothetical protein
MCVLFIFVKLKLPQDAERGKPARFVCGERGGGCQKIFQIASWWTLVSNEFEECHAF